MQLIQMEKCYKCKYIYQVLKAFYQKQEKYLINDFIMITCWMNNIFDILAEIKHTIKINFAFLFAFNMATREL